MTKIVGIVLVKNEDCFVKQALLNITGFCDVIHVLDHQSTDNTSSEIASVAALHSHIHVQQIGCVEESHAVLEPYAGEAVWVFGVDGDEVYDPEALSKMAVMLKQGDFDSHWLLLGNVVNCTEIFHEQSIATGYTTPPCRSMTKLYNFRAIDSWTGCCQRLHGGQICFKKDYDASLRHKVYETYAWEESPFRCLHTCFLPRSHSEFEGHAINGRPNITESQTKPGWFGKWGLKKRIANSTWKSRKYRQGHLVQVSSRPFFEESL